MSDLIAQLQQENHRLHVELAQLRQDCEGLATRCEHLQKSELRYRQVVENSPISILFIDTDGYLTEMNSAAEQLYGLPIKQLNQQSCPIFDNLQLVENGALSQMLRALSRETAVTAAAGRAHRRTASDR